MGRHFRFTGFPCQNFGKHVRFWRQVVWCINCAFTSHLLRWNPIVASSGTQSLDWNHEMPFMLSSTSLHVAGFILHQTKEKKLPKTLYSSTATSWSLLNWCVTLQQMNSKLSFLLCLQQVMKFVVKERKNLAKCVFVPHLHYKHILNSIRHKEVKCLVPHRIQILWNYLQNKQSDCR